MPDTKPVARTNETRFDLKKYRRLLAAGVPVVIRNESEYDQAIEQIEKFLGNTGLR